MKPLLIKYLKSNLKYLHFFYSVLKVRLFFIFLVSICYSLVDAVSLTMFIPLFQIATGESNLSVKSENKEYFYKIFEFFNLEFTVNTVLFLMLFFFFVKAVFRYFDVYYRALANTYFNKKIRFNLLKSISDLKYSKFVTIDFGTIQNSVTAEMLSINNAFGQYISVVQNMIYVLVYIVLSFLTSPKFTAIVILGGWISRFLFKTLYRNSEQLSYSITRENNRLSGLVLQQVTNFKYLKSTALMKTYLDKINKTVDDIEQDILLLSKTSAKVLSFREPIIVVFLVAAIYFQMNIVGGKFSSIVVILIFFYRAFGSLMSVQQSWTAFLKYVGSVKHYNDFVKELKFNKETESGKQFQTVRGTISLKDVSFSYGDHVKVLANVSLEIKKNTTVAFVGKSGSGKTTLINLISGLLTPTSGYIYIDGEKFEDFNIESFRSKIGFISQETVVFNDTLFNNVTFWTDKNDESLKKFYDVIEKVDLLDFMHKSELKENIILGDNGVVMSGGQRQRLSIARELFKEIEILILDEATSSLDSQTEKFIQESIEDLKGQLTIIVIAHRLSTIKKADKIILVNNGVVEEQGSYDELLSKSDAFAKMVSLQEL